MLSAQEEKTTSVKAAVEPAEDGHGKAASTASEEMAAGEETEVKSSEVTGVESAAYMPSYDEQQESKEEPKEQEQQQQGHQQQEQQEHAQQEQQQPQHIAGFYSYPQQLISQQLVPQQYAQQTSHSQAPFMVQSQAPVAAQANAPECGSASGRSSRAQNFIVDPAVDPFMYTQQRPDSASSNVLPFQQYQQQQFPYTMQYQQALYQPHHQHMQHFQILQPGMDLPMPLKSTDGVDGTVCNGTVSPTVAEQQYMQQLALQQQQLQLPPHVMHFPVSYDLSQFPGMVVPGMSMMQQPEYGASVVTERNTLEEGVQRSTNEMINVSGHDAGVQVIDSGSQSFNGDQHGNVSSTQPLAKSVTAKPTLKPRAALKRPRTKPQNWSKSQKPSMSSLLGRAIMAQPEQRARLSTIYNWIAEHFPEDYQLSVGGWQV